MARVSRPRPLPRAPAVYDAGNEAATRRTLELQLDEVRAGAQRSVDGADGIASIALRRHQFLLMGA